MRRRRGCRNVLQAKRLGLLMPADVIGGDSVKACEDGKQETGLFVDSEVIED